MNKKKPKGTSILIVNDQKKVLLLLRDDKLSIPYPNRWDVLGGHVEEGETPEQCIVREIKEEIELEISKPELFKIYNMENRIEHTFWMKADINIDITPVNEGQRLAWFAEEEVRNIPERDIAFDFKPIILEFFNSGVIK